MDKLETSQKRPLAETFERVWSQALLAVSTRPPRPPAAHSARPRPRRWSQEEMLRQAKLLTERLAGQRKDLEHNVEEGVRRALLHFKVPRREEIQDIEARLARLAERIDALGQRK